MKHVSLNLKLLFCLLLCFANTYSLVHQFTAHQVKLSAEDSIAKRNYIDFFLKQQNPDAFANKQEMKRELKNKLNKQGSPFVDLAEIEYALIGSISVGTPPQNFTVEFDPFYAVDLELIDSKANLTNIETVPAKKTYNSNASSSYVKKDGNFTSAGTGYLGTDMVNIGGLSTNMTFGILNNIGYWYEDMPIDGIFGLHLSVSKNNITSSVKQLVEKLDNPVVTVFINGTEFGDGTAQLTFGSEKSIYCEDNSGYVPLLNADVPHSFNYQFHLSKAETTIDSVKVSVELNTTVHLNPHENYIFCDLAFRNILINASGAVYNSKTGYYQVDCAGTNVSPVTLHIGETGNTTSNSSKKVVLTGADYIKYDHHYDTCYLATYTSPRYNGILYLGRAF